MIPTIGFIIGIYATVRLFGEILAAWDLSLWRGLIITVVNVPAIIIIWLLTLSLASLGATGGP
jgi:hypothetical protein